jgi:hypothetical protein
LLLYFFFAGLLHPRCFKPEIVAAAPPSLSNQSPFLFFTFFLPIFTFLPILESAPDRQQPESLAMPKKKQEKERLQ